VRQIADGDGSLRRIADGQTESVFFFETDTAITGICVFVFRFAFAAITLRTGVWVAGVKRVVVFDADAVSVFDVAFVTVAGITVSVSNTYTAMFFRARIGIACVSAIISVAVAVHAFRQTGTVLQRVVLSTFFAVIAVVAGIAHTVRLPVPVNRACALIAGKADAGLRKVFTRNAYQAFLNVSVGAPVALHAGICSLTGAYRLPVFKRARTVQTIIFTGFGYASVAVVFDVAVIAYAVRITFHFDAGGIFRTFITFAAPTGIFFTIAAAGRKKQHC